MPNQDYSYDVVLSFAGEDRKYAQELAQVLKARDIDVFYDGYEEATLWGKNLYTHLSEVYQKQARFCVMFLSQHYAQKLWTNHERSAAQARAFQENKEYILPIRLDNTDIPGLLPAIGYLKWSNADSIANAIVKKLEQETSSHRQLDEGLLPNPAPETHKQKAPIVWSETKGSIGEYKEWVIPVKPTNVNLRNFIVEAQFDNPYDGEAYNWTYGFAFQENTSKELNDPQRKSFDIWVTSKEKKWCFGTTNRFSDGYLSNLNLSEQSSNKLRLEVEGERAIFYLNDVYIETFEISIFTNKGDIFLIAKDGISGKSIQYKNLKVWSLYQGNRI